MELKEAVDNIRGLAFLYRDDYNQFIYVLDVLEDTDFLKLSLVQESVNYTKTSFEKYSSKFSIEDEDHAELLRKSISCITNYLDGILIMLRIDGTLKDEDELFNFY